MVLAFELPVVLLIRVVMVSVEPLPFRVALLAVEVLLPVFLCSQVLAFNWIEVPVLGAGGDMSVSISKVEEASRSPSSSLTAVSTDGTLRTGTFSSPLGFPVTSPLPFLVETEDDDTTLFVPLPVGATFPEVVETDRIEVVEDRGFTPTTLPVSKGGTSGRRFVGVAVLPPLLVLTLMLLLTDPTDVFRTRGAPGLRFAPLLPRVLCVEPVDVRLDRLPPPETEAVGELAVWNVPVPSSLVVVEVVESMDKVDVLFVSALVAMLGLTPARPPAEDPALLLRMVETEMCERTEETEVVERMEAFDPLGRIVAVPAAPAAAARRMAVLVGVTLRMTTFLGWPADVVVVVAGVDVPWGWVTVRVVGWRLSASSGVSLYAVSPSSL